MWLSDAGACAAHKPPVLAMLRAACTRPAVDCSLTARYQPVPLLSQAVCQGLGVLQHLLLVGSELWCRGLLESTGQARDGVVVRAALMAPRVSETGPIDRHAEHNMFTRIEDQQLLTWQLRMQTELTFCQSMPTSIYKENTMNNHMHGSAAGMARGMGG